MTPRRHATLALAPQCSTTRCSYCTHALRRRQRQSSLTARRCRRACPASPTCPESRQSRHRHEAHALSQETRFSENRFGTPGAPAARQVDHRKEPRGSRYWVGGWPGVRVLQLRLLARRCASRAHRQRRCVIRPPRPQHAEPPAQRGFPRCSSRTRDGHPTNARSVRSFIGQSSRAGTRGCKRDAPCWLCESSSRAPAASS